MTNQQRDPEADGPEGAVDPETATDDDVVGALDAEDDDVETLVEPEDPDDVVHEAPVAATAATVDRRPARLGGRPAAKAQAAPTVADEAVHVEDRASGWFVMATIGLFVVIFAWALLLGSNGPISDAFRTPRPAVTPAPSLVASPAAESPAAPSPSPVEPSAPASAAPSAS